MQTWQLQDVTQIAADAPYTFYLPSHKTKSKLTGGNLVKLMFNCDVENENGWNAERMWVEIIQRKGNDFIGRLDNIPFYIPDLKLGDEICFQALHIMQTDVEEVEEDIVEKYLPRCYVTSSVLRDKNPVRQLYRESPAEDEKNFSGWTLYSGLEDDDYLEDGDNWHYVSLGAVLNIDDGFINLLDSPVDSEFAWDDNLNQFIAI